MLRLSRGNIGHFNTAIIGLTVGVMADFPVFADHHGPASTTPTRRIEAIESAHGGRALAEKNLLTARYSLGFGEMQLDGRMTFSPSMDRVRLEVDGTSVMGYDGETAWMAAEAGASVPGPPPRFHLFTWPYFVVAPFKLDDQGTRHADAGVLPVTDFDDQRPGVRITFGEGVGDAPDDWYIAFADPDHGRLDALAYIVTYGKSKEEAEATPSIILYSDYAEIDGVWLAREWSFHFWDPASGLGEQKGSARLSDIEFMASDADLFAVPAGAERLVAPQTE